MLPWPFPQTFLSLSHPRNTQQCVVHPFLLPGYWLLLTAAHFFPDSCCHETSKQKQTNKNISNYTKASSVAISVNRSMAWGCKSQARLSDWTDWNNSIMIWQQDISSASVKMLRREIWWSILSDTINQLKKREGSLASLVAQLIGSACNAETQVECLAEEIPREGNS